ncbi:MAG TPA: trigger factor [Terriglobales bacterium]|nr:trigger factor [Terriglobales bacterium]
MSPTELKDDDLKDDAAKEGPVKESSTKREIQVEIPVAEVNRQTDTIIQKYQKVARIPGFRRGHVPASIIRQRFSEEIKTDMVEALIPRFFRQEAERLSLHPVSQPRVTDLHLHDGEPLRFKAAFEVLPEIKLQGYKELRADKPEIAVSEADVEQAIGDLRERQAAFNPVEGRALADGDFAQVSLDGIPKAADGPEKSQKKDAEKDDSQPVHMDEVLVEIAGKNTMPEFTEHLRGAVTGDERTFDVNYPEDTQDKRLAGKTFTYTVKVQAIKQKSLPELNDEFAKSLGEFQTVDDIRKVIREQIESERRHEAEHAAKEKLVGELIERNDFEVPDSLVDQQIDIRLERGLRALAAQGLTAEQMKKMDLQRLRVGQRDQAIHDVKAALLLERVAEEENVQVSDEELNHELEALARQSKQTSEAVRARLTRDGGLDRIRTRIRNEKTLDFLYRQSA